VDNWTFGGGTAMMLQIDHRESRDIDILLCDPQELPYLNPETHDFDFEIWPNAYEGDGAHSLKFVFEGIGEIDFIVAGARTSSPTTEANIEGETVLLETVPEIITKKIYYRALSIQPRDIFDIAAAVEQYEGPLIEALQAYRDKVGQALKTINELQPTFVQRTMADLIIKDAYRGIATNALERSKKILQAVLQVK
jgi:hypothetical protein